MARLLMWVILIHFIKRSWQQDCKDFIERKSFDCGFSYDGSQPSLRCESMIPSDGPVDENFYFLQIYWKEEITNLHDNQSLFQTYLNSPFSSTSMFYKCESIWRNFIDSDPSVLSLHCLKRRNCLQHVSGLISKWRVKKVEIYNAKSSNIFKIINEFHFLQEIDLHDNLLLNLSDLNYGNINQARILSLRNNNLDDVPDGIFSKLIFLETLDLSHNRIELLTNHSLGNLFNLKTLNLSLNSISEISRNHFSGQPNLRFVYFINNNLQSIKEDTFVNNILLTSIDLSYNPLKILPGGLLHNLKNLELFACSSCNISEIPDGLFIDSLKLKTADFSYNSIENVSLKTFEKQALLEYINLQYNKLTALPDLRNKTYLIALHFYHNELLSLNTNLTIEAPSLKYLNVSENKIEYLSDSHVKNYRDLEDFDLSKNRITTVQLGIANNIVNIRNLILSHNFVRKFDIQWRTLRVLENLYMDFNEITHLELPPCIPSVKQTVTFTFQHNKISTLKMNSLLEDEKRIITDRMMAGCLFNGLSKNFVDISHNPLNCDCKLYPFYNYLKEKRRIKLDTFFNQANITCSEPPRLKNASLISLPEDAFSCSFSTDCPPPCTCGIRGKDNQTFVNCSETGLREIPQNAPVETTVLYFNKNYLEDINSLNNPCWEKLTEVHLDDNGLVDIPENWNIPENLQYLSVRSNKLKDLPEYLKNFIANRSDFELLFGGNDKNCSCSSKDLKRFLKENKDFVIDIDDIVCEIESNGTQSLLPLYTIPNSVLCAIPVILGFDPTVTVLSLSAGFIFLIMILLVYYKQKQLIMSFIYIYCDEIFPCCFNESDDDDDKEFDAFVAYSSCERDIVMEILHELEEKEPHFQLCIHERNWLPGRFISDNIVDSVQNSKRTIVILSNNFISSPWFRLELRAAIFQVSGDRKNKLIVIMADKSTTLDDIDTEIRHVISKRTYLVWGERWFWEKLRYVMPRKSCFESTEFDKIDNVDPMRRNSDIALIDTV